jgi:hypothetical protein
MPRNTCVRDGHGYVPFVVVTIAPFLALSSLITWFFTRLPQRMPLLEQDLPWHLWHICSVASLTQVFRGHLWQRCSVVISDTGVPWSSLTQVFRDISDAYVPWHLWQNIRVRDVTEHLCQRCHGTRLSEMATEHLCQRWPRNNTKMIHKTQYRKDLATRIQLKITGDLRCSIRLIRSCSNSGIRCGSLVKNQVIRDDRAKKKHTSSHGDLHYIYRLLTVNLRRETLVHVTKSDIHKKHLQNYRVVCNYC